MRLLTEGAASAIRDSTLLCYRAATNFVLRKRDACLKDFPLPTDSARELRTHPVKSLAVFDNAVSAVRQHAIFSGHIFPKSLTKPSTQLTHSSGRTALMAIATVSFLRNVVICRSSVTVPLLAVVGASTVKVVIAVGKVVEKAILPLLSRMVSTPNGELSQTETFLKRLRLPSNLTSTTRRAAHIISDSDKPSDSVRQTEVVRAASPACFGSPHAIRITPHQLPVGEYLSSFIQAWELIVDDVWVLNVICHRYLISFYSRIPPSLVGGGDYLLPHVQTLLGKLAIEVVTDDLPFFFSRLFLVPKPDGSKRPIIDL